MPATLIRFDPPDWARCRFSRSLLWETVQAVRTLLDPRQQAYHQAWLATIDPGEAVRALPALVALNPAVGWVPDFLAPPPSVTARSIDDELAAVAAYPVELALADIRRTLASAPAPGRTRVLNALLDDPAHALEQLVAELHYAWTQLMAPFWGPVDELVRADIAFRSGEVTRHGFETALHGLHPGVSVTPTTVTVHHAEELEVALGGRGLVLMPSAFVWPRVVLVHGPPWPPTLIYPARGIGTLWAAPPAPASGLTAALGRTRAALLADLDVPATTTALSVRHELSMAAVSAQLGRLQAARLVSSQRVGREVCYRRTDLGDRLVGANRL